MAATGLGVSYFTFLHGAHPMIGIAPGTELDQQSLKHILASPIWYGFNSRPSLPKEAQRTPCQSDLTA